ncbi:MAG: M48 family metallopeptidase [Verrucomicrobiales bacterium]|nr:M48 family metallopeptidase [Verrucomicrobiales bacterium]
MDFFDRQELARKNSKHLIFYYIVAVIGIVCSFGFAVLGARYLFLAQQSAQTNSLVRQSFFDPEFFLYSALGVLVLIILSTLFKISTLSEGGAAVAKSLGGKEVDPTTKDPRYRRLINVVEEMSIASGVSVPSIYVMDQEDGINAFAAGHSSSNATIGVTAGCLNKLNRSELQGVIAHEFSHILNGDMRLNIRMMSVLYGILMMFIVGKFMLRSFGRSSSRSRSNSKEGGGAAFIIVVSLALLLIGLMGSIMAKLIKAAVSRQREFLADASAVQFTRDPSGISGALKKIGGFAGAKIEHPRGEEVSHMFFGSCYKKKLSNLLATHPPIDDRIRAIGGASDGFQTLPEESELNSDQISMDETQSLVSSFSDSSTQRSDPEKGFFQEKDLNQIGQIMADQVVVAQRIVSEIDESLISLVHQKSGALAVVYSLLLSEEDLVRGNQLKVIKGACESEVSKTFKTVSDQVIDMHSTKKIALLDLAVPALRRLSPEEYGQFCEIINELINIDEQVDLFEFMIQKNIRLHLDAFFGRIQPPNETIKTLSKLNHESSVLLSAIAGFGNEDELNRLQAFKKGAAVLELSGTGKLKFLPPENCGIGQMDEALKAFEKCVPTLKKTLLIACGKAAISDGKITSNEAEILRAIGDSMGTPIPPFVYT